MNVAIIGASANRDKFGNKAVRAYVNQGHTVFPVNTREDTVEGLTAFNSVTDIPEDLDRVSIYLPPDITLRVLPAIAAKGTAELYLNPGTESDEVVAKAAELGLKTIHGCSIVDIGESPSNYF